jgi:steroid 5-alpha reductase family enzyme
MKKVVVVLRSILKALVTILLIGTVVRAMSLQDFGSRKALKFAFIFCILTSLSGIFAVEHCFTYGYGLSLLFTGVICTLDFSSFVKAYACIPRALIIAFALNALAYVFYGIRMIYFIIRRNVLTSDQNALWIRRNTAHVKDISTLRKIFVSLNIGILLCFYSLPLNFYLVYAFKVASNQISKLSTWKFVPIIVSIISSCLAMGSLCLQLVADEQKLRHRKLFIEYSLNSNDEDIVVQPFCTSGLYSKWRHPNYVAEILYHSFIFFASIPAYEKWYTYLLSLVGPLSLVIIILVATIRLDQRQMENYSGKDGSYERWVQRTRKFL